jgi:hypothetical protein
MIAADDSRAPTAGVLDRGQARDPATVTGRLLAVQAQDLRRGAARGAWARMAGLTAVDVDRALTDERSLAVMWLNRGARQQKQKAPKRLAKAKRDRRPTRRRSKRTGAWLGASPER